MNKLTEAVIYQTLWRVLDEAGGGALGPIEPVIRKMMKEILPILTAQEGERKVHWTADYPCPDYCPDKVTGGCNAGWVVYCERYGKWQDPAQEGENFCEYYPCDPDNNADYCPLRKSKLTAQEGEPCTLFESELLNKAIDKILSLEDMLMKYNPAHTEPEDEPITNEQYEHLYNSLGDEFAKRKYQEYQDWKGQWDGDNPAPQEWMDFENWLQQEDK